MKRVIILFIILQVFFLIFYGEPAFCQSQIQATRDKVLQYAKPKKPLKIKLHRDKKGEYTWDITGENVEDIIKVDKRLRQYFEGQ